MVIVGERAREVTRRPTRQLRWRLNLPDGLERQGTNVALFRRNTSESHFIVAGHRSEYLVGTEHYAKVYAKAREGQEVLVELVAEVGNVHDPNAVAGTVNGEVAGYLRQEVAAKYRKALEDAQALGLRVCVSSEFRPRKDASMGMGWLDMPSPEALRQWLALPPDQRSRGFDFAAGKSPNTPRAVGKPL